jgi:hypothetical protein
MLCEWHIPETNGISGAVEVCYWANAAPIQCYRIEGDRVTDYHLIEDGDFFWAIQEISGQQSQPWSPIKLQKISPDISLWDVDAAQRFRDRRLRLCTAEEIESKVRPFETKGLGYISVMSWTSDRVQTFAVYPLDTPPAEFKEFRDVFEKYMNDPSTCENHFSYLRAYSVPPPDKQGHVFVFNADQWPRTFGSRQRDVLNFITAMKDALIPVNKGVDPFRKFGIPYTPGSSLTINYRSSGSDNFRYRNGDNFLRIKIYDGNVALN